MSTIENHKKIIEFFNDYKNKIINLNKNGYYDNAKGFEMFAIEIANIFFNANDFENVNKGKSNIKGIDLYSSSLNCSYK